jgi:hypothetical protein
MSKNIFILSIITLVTIIGWVFFSLLHVTTSSQIAPSIYKNAEAIPGVEKLDKDVLEKIYQKKDL